MGALLKVWAAMRAHTGITLAIGAILAVVAYVGMLQLDVASLTKAKLAEELKTQRLTTQVETLKQDVETANWLRKMDRAGEKVLIETLKGEVARAQATTESLKEIDNAPPSDDAPVAPVLRRAIERLPQH